MINFYVKRIVRGRMKWTDVPDYWNEDVQSALKDAGYVLNDDGTVEKADK